jgi:excisionase family DNA binding protein
MTVDVAPVERATYSVREAAVRLGVGKDAVYECIKRKEFPFGDDGPVRVLRFGTRLVIPRVDLDAFLRVLANPGGNDAYHAAKLEGAR